MKKIILALILIAVIIFSAGCITEKPSYTDKDGNVYTGDEAEGSINYADGSVEIWHTDLEGNIFHVFTDTDGSVVKYYINKNGEVFYED
ncbi:MAG: hypothetical protein Q4Q53_01550 [Methanocorpusculum sp.]|nr:hypothetical protein [Methanocorpusculum sp.]